MIPLGVTVQRDGNGYSAFAIDTTAKLHRLSPTWKRDVMQDVLTEFTVRTHEPGRMAKVKRMAPVKVGEKLVYGEQFIAATERAIKALKRIAKGLDVEVPKEKKL